MPRLSPRARRTRALLEDLYAHLPEISREERLSSAGFVAGQKRPCVGCHGQRVVYGRLCRVCGGRGWKDWHDPYDSENVPRAKQDDPDTPPADQVKRTMDAREIDAELERLHADEEARAGRTVGRDRWEVRERAGDYARLRATLDAVHPWKPVPGYDLDMELLASCMGPRYIRLPRWLEAEVAAELDAEIRELAKEGLTSEQIADELQIHEVKVRKYLRSQRKVSA